MDRALPGILNALAENDGMLVLTADHGCDPTYHGSDHTREYIPALLWYKGITPQAIGTRTSFADLGATILKVLGAPAPAYGKSIF